MPNYTLYRDDIETIEPDESETHARIIEVMTDGMKNIGTRLRRVPIVSGKRLVRTERLTGKFWDPSETRPYQLFSTPAAGLPIAFP